MADAMFVPIGSPFGRPEKKPALPIPEAQVATLREAYERYAAGFPFKAGDLVTPRPGFHLSNVGQPHVAFGDTPGSTAFGVRLDVRVACFHEFGDGSVVAFWQESWCLETYGEGRP